MVENNIPRLDRVSYAVHLKPVSSECRNSIPYDVCLHMLFLARTKVQPNQSGIASFFPHRLAEDAPNG